MGNFILRKRYGIFMIIKLKLIHIVIALLSIGGIVATVVVVTKNNTSVTVVQVTPTAEATDAPTATPDGTATATPTLEPTETPTIEPTIDETVTATATLDVTSTPTVEPTTTPTPTATDDGDDDDDAIIVIEGPVTAINITTITIFDIDIQVDPADPILTQIQIGDRLRVQGNTTYNGTTIIIVAINITIVNIDVIVVDGGGGIGLPANCKMTKKGKITCKDTRRSSRRTSRD